MGEFGRPWRLGRSLWDRGRGKDIPEQLMQRLDMCKNTACTAGVSHVAGLGSASKFPETCERRLERELRSVAIEQDKATMHSLIY